MNDRIEAEAAEWIARRNGGLSPTEQTEFAAWVAKDARHREAIALMELTWSQLNAPRRFGEADRAWTEIERHRRRRSRRHRITWSALGMAAAVAVMIAVGTGSPVHPEGTPAALHLPDLRALADGSKVALRVGADIEVDFSPDARHVRLVRGEAMFSVAHDSGRPFVVHAGNVMVRAVGTEFSVAYSTRATTVYVTEGRIAVTQTGSADAALPVLYASAGERVILPAAGTNGPAPAVTRVRETEIASALAWRGQRLEFSDLPLAEAVRMINRGRDVQLVLADPDIGRRTITGVLWADDGDGFVRLLEQGFDLSAERDGNVVRLRPRSDR
jgi:transmembrane sensor